MLKWLDPLEEEHTGWEEIEMTNSMIKKDWYSHRTMRTPLRKRHGINTWHWSNSNTTTKQKKGLACRINRKQTYDRDLPNPISCICRKDILGAIWIPTYKLPKLSGYAIRCWGYRGSIISHPKLAHPTSSCIHPSTRNQETFGNRIPQPSKSIRYTSYGNTPELAPVLGYRGYLTNNCTKEIFDVGKAQVFQNYNDKIVMTTPQSSTPRVKAT